MKRPALLRAAMHIVLCAFLCVCFFCMPPAAQTDIAAAKPASDNSVINIKCGQTSFKINLADYEIKTNSFAILSGSRRQLRYGRTAQQKFSYAKKLHENGIPRADALCAVFVGLDKEIAKIAAQVKKPAIDAKMHFDPLRENFSFVNEKSGVYARPSQIGESIFDAIATGSNKAFVKLFAEAPKLTAAMLQEATYFRAAFETGYEKSTPERKHNIAVAAAKINGRVIYPGQTFSFNAATGRRSEKAGYLPAKIIKNGKFEDGVGGGVCQVSTTLYNAALVSGLDCMSQGHSLPVSYVPAGLDAMVAGGGSDLTITNNLQLPVAIKMTANGKSLRAEFFGSDMSREHYVPFSEFIDDLPSKEKEFIKKTGVKKGKVLREGFDGFIMQSYRHKFVNGRLVGTERLRRTTYESVGEIVAL